MDHTSCFIENTALFGGFPTQESVNILENEGVRYFLNLTRPNEKRIVSYITKYHYENYAIFDHSYPNDRISFGKLIVKYVNIIHNLQEGEKIYIHCRGGHGRSSMVAACLVCWYYKISPQEAMEKVAHYHSSRKIMAEKWRYTAAPQRKNQRNFVISFFKPVYIMKLMEGSLADIFDGVNLTESYDKIFIIVLQRFGESMDLVNDILSTGLGKIIFVFAKAQDREKISDILSQIRTYFFSILGEPSF